MTKDSLPEPPEIPQTPPNGQVAWFRLNAEPESLPSVGGRLAIGTIVPGFEILDELGHGAMSVVYRARQLAVDRMVALKVLLANPHASEKVRVRFQTEAHTLATLRHPNIVQLHDYGTHAGNAYLVLEYVEGGTLGDRLKAGTVDLREAATLMEVLARAVQFAHDHGVIHRDLKPANILMTQDPSSELPLVKIGDFGLARWLEGESHLTTTGAVVGTPSYMAPELLQGAHLSVGPTTDIYSLGVILYEMLAGRRPFEATTTGVLMLQITARDPIPPAYWRAELPTDLQTICLKCLSKEPAQRYATAAALADDLRRFLDGKPTLARPLGPLARVTRSARRNPLVAALSLALCSLVLTAMALVTWQMVRANREWERAEEKSREEAAARRQAERLTASAELDLTLRLCEQGAIHRGMLRLADALESAVRLEDQDLERVVRINLTSWRQMLIRKRAAFPHPNWAWAIAFSPDGQTVATGSYDKTVQRWDVATGKAIGPALQHPHPVWSVAFSPDGKLLLTGCGPTNNQPGESRVWDAQTGALRHGPVTHPDLVRSVAFSADGRFYLTVCSTQANLWQTTTHTQQGQPLRHFLPTRSPVKLTNAHFSPDSRSVLTAGEDGKAILWTTHDAMAQGTPWQHQASICAIAFRPGGREVAIGSQDGLVQMWDVKTGTQLQQPLLQRGPVKALGFSGDGQRLAVSVLVRDRDVGAGKEAPTSGIVQVWDVANSQTLGPALEHPLPVWDLAFHPNNRLLLTGCVDGHARFWQVPSGVRLGKPLAHRGNVRAVLFSRNGTLALTADAGGGKVAAQLWDVPSMEPPYKQLPHPAAVNALAFSPGGERLLTGAGDNLVRQWDLATGCVVGQPLSLTMPVRSVGYGAGGERIMGASWDSLRVWETASGKLIREMLGPKQSPLLCADIRSDGLWTLVARLSGHIGCVENATGNWWHPRGYEAGGRGVRTVAQSTDGRYLFWGDYNGKATLWDRETDRQVLRLNPGTSVEAVAYSADGQRVATATRAGLIHIWDVQTGRATRLMHHEGAVRSVKFSPDGSSLLSGSSDRTMRLWDVATGKPLTPPFTARRGLQAVAYDPAGRTLAMGGDEQLVQFWHVPQPFQGDPEQVRNAVRALTGYELDEQGEVRPHQP